MRRRLDLRSCPACRHGIRRLREAARAGHRDERVRQGEQCDHRPGAHRYRLPRHPAIDQAAHQEWRGERTDAERHVEQAHRAAAAFAIDVQDESVRASIEASGADPDGHRRNDEGKPGRGETQPRDPRRRRDDRGTEGQATTSALSERSTDERSERVREGVHEVDEPDACVGLIERLLDGPQKRGNEQARPPHGEERQRRHDACGEPSTGRHRPLWRRCGRLDGQGASAGSGIGRPAFRHGVS